MKRSCGSPEFIGDYTDIPITRSMTIMWRVRVPREKLDYPKIGYQLGCLLEPRLAASTDVSTVARPSMLIGPAPWSSRQNTLAPCWSPHPPPSLCRTSSPRPFEPCFGSSTRTPSPTTTMTPPPQDGGAPAPPHGGLLLSRHRARAPGKVAAGRCLSSADVTIQIDRDHMVTLLELL